MQSQSGQSTERRAFWKPVAGNTMMKWARKRRMSTNVSLGTNEQDPRPFWGAALVSCYFWGIHTNILSSFVLSICMSPFGLKSIFCCHKKTASHSWRSWDGGNEAAAPVPSALLDPSSVTDKKAWSTSQNIWLGKHISDATFKFIYLSFHLKLGRLSCSQYLSKEVSGNNDSPYRKVSTTFTEEHHKLRYLFQT